MVAIGIILVLAIGGLCLYNSIKEDKTKNNSNDIEDIDIHE